MIEVENLTKVYAAAPAVRGISFRVEKNEIVGFLGPNGAGKSTTLKVLTCYHSATSGRVRIDGLDVTESPEEVKRRIGYLPENVPLYPEMRVMEYLHYRAALKRVPRRMRTAAIDGAVDRCRIGDVRHRIVGQLSKGYRQRVGLADALLADPKILILDEPTVGLDPNQIRDVRGLIRELGRERTVVLSSHILPEVEATCSRVIIIDRGQIVGQGQPDELRRLVRRGSEVRIVVKDGDDRVREQLLQIPGVTAVEPLDDPASPPEARGFSVLSDGEADLREPLFDCAVASGFKLLEMNRRIESLEDIFVHITTAEAGPAAPDAGEAAS